MLFHNFVPFKFKLINQKMEAVFSENITIIIINCFPNIDGCLPVRKLNIVF